MEDLKKIETLVDHALEYANIRVDEIKLGLVEKESAIADQLVATTMVNAFFFLCLFFAGVAAALVLGDWWNHGWLGFLTVAGIFLIIGIVVRMVKEKMLWKQRHQLRLRRDDMERTIRKDWQDIYHAWQPVAMAKEALNSCTTWIGKKFFSRQHAK